MGLESTFRHLAERFLELHRKVMELQEFVDCKPEYDDAAVADDFSDKTLELQGAIREARLWAKTALHSVLQTADGKASQRALGQCQEKFHQVEQIFASHLVSYEKLSELARVRVRDPDWSSWGIRVRRGIEECREPLTDVRKAIASCWQELAERSGAISISVKTTGMIQNLGGERKPEVGEEKFYAGGP